MAPLARNDSHEKTFPIIDIVFVAGFFIRLPRPAARRPKNSGPRPGPH